MLHMSGTYEYLPTYSHSRRVRPLVSVALHMTGSFIGVRGASATRLKQDTYHKVADRKTSNGPSLAG